jgi:hypothetical protein
MRRRGPAVIAEWIAWSLALFATTRSPSYVERSDGRAGMAVSTCIKCGGHGFELVLFTPLGGSHKFMMVQCPQCGTPAGVVDPAMAPQIEALKHQVAAIDERLSRIAKALQE